MRSSIYFSLLFFLFFFLFFSSFLSFFSFTLSFPSFSLFFFPLFPSFYFMDGAAVLPAMALAQSVTCLATDACLTADPGVASSIPARYHTFVEIDHEIISTVILLPSADLFKKDCCQLQAKVWTNYWLTACSSLPRKKCG